jgi:hypothetical protein
MAERFADRGYYNDEEVLACRERAFCLAFPKRKPPTIRTAGFLAGRTLSTTPRMITTPARRAKSNKGAVRSDRRHAIVDDDHIAVAAHHLRRNGAASLRCNDG